MDTYTSEDLIGMVRTDGGFPDAGTEGTTDADILDRLNDQAFDLYGEIMKVHEEYFCRTERTALVSNKSKYRIPSRAMFGKLRDIRGYASDGTIYPINHMNRENMHRFASIPTSEVRPISFYLEGMYVVFFPSLTSVEGSVDFTYFFRPGALVKSTDCRKVESLGPGAGQVTLESAVPSSWTTSPKYDIHSGVSGAEVKCWSLTASAVVGDLMTFAAADIDGSAVGRFPVEVGDWVCLEEQAALPGLPREMHPLLARGVIMGLKGDKFSPEEYQAAKIEYNGAIKSIKEILAIRVEGVQEVVDTTSFFIG